MEVVNALGRRKAAVARVFVCEGSGESWLFISPLQYFNTL